ncbi:hypothetical protein [uncultured Kordia sp.]|uniref:hypothetical protein n=1 Tax=uncultured Kordia sp. TaxID=507699 RepID=UPI002616EFDB|nr:hypothetical protein [uncultured Kordia sp.]
MKKRNLTLLQLNKKAISNFSNNTLTGGKTDWPETVKLCPKTLDCPASHLETCEPCFKTLLCGSII